MTNSQKEETDHQNKSQMSDHPGVKIQQFLAKIGVNDNGTEHKETWGEQNIGVNPEMKYFD